MPETPHIERHFTASESVRDVVIGMADGLTVPFALAAGLTGAITSAPEATKIIITAGLAEIAAGSIAMGLGGYLAARSDAEHYASERRREEEEIIEKPKAEVAEVRLVLENYGLTPEESESVALSISQRPRAWVDFMMRFELGLEEPDPKRALVSAATIAGSYIAGGMIPLGPYMIFSTISMALTFSVIMTILALGVFGYIKGRFTGSRPWRSSIQTMVIGGLAASAAFGLAKLIS